MQLLAPRVACEATTSLLARDAQRAARSRACLFVRGGNSMRKRASAHKALIRMSIVD
jgi:hypothetical protein